MHIMGQGNFCKQADEKWFNGPDEEWKAAQGAPSIYSFETASGL